VPLVGITDLLLRDPELVEEDFENLFVGVHGGGGGEIVYGCKDTVSRSAELQCCVVISQPCHTLLPETPANL
jgi:hypothetical protein